VSASHATITPVRAGLRTHPVIEIFGPTIQGEGAEAGLPTHFVRFGGCDYRCAWCDTVYAVDPAIVRATSQKLTADEIVTELGRLGGHPEWVTLSGGNPALHRLGELVDRLHASGYRVAAETQGSVWRPWLQDLDRLTISPKPPSSEMADARRRSQFERFMEAARAAADRAVLKIVCFDERDVTWAKQVAGAHNDLPLYLSAGTPVPSPGNVRDAVGERYRWLCETVAADPLLSRARVLPQLHVIAWKEATGV
jgi:7-carboxy-7-deazaguanine synthase